MLTCDSQHSGCHSFVSQGMSIRLSIILSFFLPKLPIIWKGRSTTRLAGEHDTHIDDAEDEPVFRAHSQVTSLCVSRNLKVWGRKPTHSLHATGTTHRTAQRSL